MTVTDLPFLLTAVLAGAGWIMVRVFDRCEAADDAALLAKILDDGQG